MSGGAFFLAGESPLPAFAFKPSFTFLLVLGSSALGFFCVILETRARMSARRDAQAEVRGWSSSGSGGLHPVPGVELLESFSSDQLLEGVTGFLGFSRRGRVPGGSGGVPLEDWFKRSGAGGSRFATRAPDGSSFPLSEDAGWPTVEGSSSEV